MATQNVTIQQHTEKFAKSDLTYARKNGLLCVCQTKVGNVELTYDRDSKLYNLKACDRGQVVDLGSHKLSKAIQVLAPLYVVEGV